MRPIHKLLGLAAAVLLLAGAIAGAVQMGADVQPSAAQQRGNAQSGAAAAAAASSPKVACDREDAPGKGWVLAVHVHQPGKGDYRTAAGKIRQVLWDTDQTFDASARRFGISKRIRYVQDASCRPRVADMAFRKGRDRAEMNAEFQKNIAGQPADVQKLVKDRRVKLLFFVADDAITDSCTGGGADAGISNGGAILPLWCWGEGGLTHEFGHTLGLSHCGGAGEGMNGNDPMCRDMGKRPECTSDAASNYHLDSCRTDEFRYFEPKRPKGKKALPRNRNVVYSPYLISNQPSKPVAFRMRVEGTSKCVDGGRTAAILLSCRAAPQQTWQRRIDRWGYTTLRNAGTGRCLQMTTKPKAPTAAVVTARCAAGKRSQQWVPSGANFANRTGGLPGATLSTLSGGKGDGTLIVRGGGTTFVADFAVGKGSRAKPVLNKVAIRSAAHGTCLAPQGAAALRLGSCARQWQIVPTARLGYGLRINGRCLTQGPAKPGTSRRTAGLTPCKAGNRDQLWLFKTGTDGTTQITNASATAVNGQPSQSEKSIIWAEKSSVYAAAPYPSSGSDFRIG